MPRGDAEDAVIGFAERGVRSSIVRDSPTTHSALDRHGFARVLVQSARRTGIAGYPGDGANRWSAANTLDVGHCFRMALDKAPAGSRFNAVGDEGIPMREIAQSIGDHASLQTASIPQDQLESHFGFLAMFIALDNRTSNAFARCRLGWKPTDSGLIADFENGDYFTKDHPWTFLSFAVEKKCVRPRGEVADSLSTPEINVVAAG